MLTHWSSFFWRPVQLRSVMWVDALRAPASRQACDWGTQLYRRVVFHNNSCQQCCSCLPCWGTNECQTGPLLPSNSPVAEFGHTVNLIHSYRPLPYCARCQFCQIVEWANAAPSRRCPLEDRSLPSTSRALPGLNLCARPSGVALVDSYQGRTCAVMQACAAHNALAQVAAQFVDWLQPCQS